MTASLLQKIKSSTSQLKYLTRTIMPILLVSEVNGKIFRIVNVRNVLNGVFKRIETKSRLTSVNPICSVHLTKAISSGLAAC